MNHTVTRFAGPLTGLFLAAVVGASPVLAAPAPPSDTGATVGQSEELNARRYCAREWAEAKAHPTLENYQAVGSCEIDRRLETIERLRDLVRESEALTDSHAAALTRILDASASGLRALRTEIEGDTTVDAVKEDVRRISTDFRIYVLVVRQVVLVRADDRVEAAVVRLTAAAGRLSHAIETAASSGKDVTEAQAHLAAMKAAIDAAASDVAGDADAILALTPAAWNAGTAKPILDAARASIAAARTDLQTARTEARAVLAALR